MTKIGMRDWGPFTIPVDPYLLELVCEFYASYKAWKIILHHKDRADTIPCLLSVWNTTQVPIKVAILFAYIVDDTHINVGEIIADQFKRKAKQQATSLPYPSLVSILCLWDSCPLFRSLDKSMRVEGVITLDTKTDKDAPALKRPRAMEDRIQPPPSMLSNITHS
ncbi:hypothetical protein HAX54_052731 [Datura stramonium]|uniref:Uncharacterized protein n=1 Tax=Datura stramonium TaxID=4076 RepID=A0ABS8WRF5_DATST|nr:hypothetical protein [Datura stramonium]